ncbi:hypothetical protein PF007_g22922 [Phytophthora fragariae]|uniref:DDE Tnp4 domain-containing protein n=2 Tax=Phytophthora fragariae TaxID=53985 RepID=A0A6A3QPP0_9STRA|nr:hypothetical protein PF003_g22468 [Phytophthora fragariae]KAE9080755.1 hypothetical protein PF007_g22922 [Phytophthora fragariae]KAE9195674.1 hypothetical protein PF004_g20368 [Phytophthora fragariae]
MLEEDEGMLLLLCEAFKAHNERVRDAHRDVHQLMLEEEWRIAMRTRHYLTTRCLDAPCESAWMTLYMCGSDVNFLNATSLTRGAFHQLLSSSWPSPSRQAELARMVNKREPLLTHTFGFIDGKNLRVQQPSNADLQNAIVRTVGISEIKTTFAGVMEMPNLDVFEAL